MSTRRIRRKSIETKDGSPTILVDGHAVGIWSHNQKKDNLEIHFSPFSRLESDVPSRIEEAAELGRFLGCPNVKTTFGK
ncbi:winged helix DNA-binding domain-containing protein [Candidatus Bathyarchaeota archaeon]|nr:MAG: winged helix DNA-binding domain-containing protein [Candidatus Bathyarchaeota archaeon]